MDERLGKADLLIDLGKYDLAEMLVRESLAQDPQNDSALCKLSYIKSQTGYLDESIEYINIAIGIQPNNASYLVHKAYVLLNLSRFEEAEIFFETAATIDANNPEVFTFWANLKIETGDFKQALEFSNIALELDPTSITAMVFNSIALMHLGIFEESKQILERALSTEPNNKYVWLNLGCCCLELKEYDDAKYYFEKTLKLDPEYKLAMKGLQLACKMSFRPFEFMKLLSYRFKRFKNKTKNSLVVFSSLIEFLLLALVFIFPSHGTLFTSLFLIYSTVTVFSIYFYDSIFSTYLILTKPEVSKLFWRSEKVSIFSYSILFVLLIISIVFAPLLAISFKWSYVLMLIVNLLFLIDLTGGYSAFLRNDALNSFVAIAYAILLNINALVLFANDDKETLDLVLILSLIYISCLKLATFLVLANQKRALQLLI